MSFIKFFPIFCCCFLAQLSSRVLASQDLLSIELLPAPPPNCPTPHKDPFSYLTKSFHIRIRNISNSHSDSDPSSIVLRLHSLPSSQPPYKVFELDAKGKRKRVDMNQFGRFVGVVMCQPYVRKVYAMGTVQPNIISLVIMSLDFYITPAAVKSPRKLALNPHKKVPNPYLPQLLRSSLMTMSMSGGQGGSKRKLRLSRRSVEDANPNKNRICGMKIRVMYDLYSDVFQKDILKAVLLVHYVVRFADEIFRSTVWTHDGYFNETKVHTGEESYDTAFFDFGFSLCEVEVETALPDYVWTDMWNEQSVEDYILDSISDVNQCLSHALTNRSIVTHSGGQLLGISYTDGLFSKKNGGVSSFNQCHDPWDTKCVLSIVHEFGHTWGSYHDADAEGCLPSGRDGGSFLMSYPFLAEVGPNNFQFSPCSIRAIYKVIERMRNNFISHHCGMLEDCGDLIVQNGEECDDGPDGSNCCDRRTCKLVEGAVCSPSNGMCCDPETCRPKSSNSLCLPQDLEFCLDRSVCDGFNHTCPYRKGLPNGSACELMGQKGTCSSGFCYLSCPRDEVPCECGSKFQCHQCCRSPLGICKPTFPLVDQSPCRFNGSLPGQCRIGQCVSMDQDFPRPTIVIDGDTRATTETPGEEEEANANYVMISTILVLIFIFAAFLVLKLFYLNTSKFHYSWNPDEIDATGLISMPNGLAAGEPEIEPEPKMAHSNIETI